MTSPRGVVTAMTYTGRNLLATVTEAFGTGEATVVRSLTYTPTRKVASETDALGRVTQFAYGVCCDRLKTITDPAGYLTQFLYDFVGNRTSVSDGNGLITLTTYDARSRVATVRNPANEITVFSYDDNLSDGVGIDAAPVVAAVLPGLGLGAGADGSAVAVTDPLTHTSYELRDGLGRTVARIDALGHATKVAYDAVVGGLVETAVTDALNHVTRSRSDAAGQARQQVDALGHVATATFDAYGKQTITGPTGIVRTKSAVGWDRGFTGYITDNETGLLHARARQYSPTLGRFVGRDPVRYRLNRDTNFPSPGPGDGYLEGYSLYESYFVPNGTDPRGLWGAGSGGKSKDRKDWGHSDFPGHDIFDYNAEDNDLLTNPVVATPNHFQDLAESEKQLQNALRECAKQGFERRMHRMQDYYAHVQTGYQAYGGKGVWGHGLNKEPDDPTIDPKRFDDAAKKSQEWVDKWKECCCLVGGEWKPKSPRPAYCGAAPPDWPRLPNRGGHARKYWK